MAWECRYPHQYVLAGRLRSIFQVQTDQMLCKFPVEHLVNLVEHQVQEIETGDQRGGEVYVLSDCRVYIVF